MSQQAAEYFENLDTIWVTGPGQGNICGLEDVGVTWDGNFMSLPGSGRFVGEAVYDASVVINQQDLHVASIHLFWREDRLFMRAALDVDNDEVPDSVDPDILVQDTRVRKCPDCPGLLPRPGQPAGLHEAGCATGTTESVMSR